METKNECANLQELVKEMSINKGHSYIIPSSAIKIQRRLGSGEFGVVQQAVWMDHNNKITVAVKCLTQLNIQSNPTEFIKEARIMYAIKHENIVRLFGIVLDGETQMLVTELAPMRSLLECLKDLTLREDFLNVLTLCEFTLQISKGMEYLENKRLIHRDLAARNILVFSKDVVKISDFGLSRALSVDKTYYQTHFTPNLKLPIAWCAPESINFLRFTTSSDVFSFGVCLWEIFSYGMQPWQAMTGQQILEAIDEPNFHRLEKPDYCSEDYYSLMIKCWLHDPTKRPKFSEIVNLLPLITPIQVKALSCYEGKQPDMLKYEANDLITVLDSTTKPYWKGVLNNGKLGFFDPHVTDFICRTSTKHQHHKSAKKKSLFSKVLSSPSNALKFDTSANDITKQFVEDQEHLLPLTPNSPDCNHYFENSGRKPSIQFNFFETYDMEHTENNVHKDDDNVLNSMNSYLLDNENACKSNEESAPRRAEETSVLPRNVKLISSKDQKILDQAIEIAYKCSTKSMKCRLDKTSKKKVKKKNNGYSEEMCSNDLDNATAFQPHYESKNFSEKIREQAEISFTKQSKEAYDNLVQKAPKDSNYSFVDTLNDDVSKRMNKSKPDLSLSIDDNLEDNLNISKFHVNSLNSVPLPPKPQLSIPCTKRHVRKHPLVVNKGDNEQLKIEYENIESTLPVLKDTSLIKF